MNVAIIFAGGVGQRMGKTSLPKQFLEVSGKPVIIHTLLHFENHQDIDGIIIACRKEYIPLLDSMVKTWNIRKTLAIVEGGKTGQESIYNALCEVEKLLLPDDTIVLIHDGVRPFITDKVITDNINVVKQSGAAITVSAAIETVCQINKDTVSNVFDRSKCFLAKAPQSFVFRDLFKAHKKAIQEGINNMTDSATLMSYYGKKLFPVECSYSNIKITTPTDFYFMRALIAMEEDKQLEKL